MKFLNFCETALQTVVYLEVIGSKSSQMTYPLQKLMSGQVFRCRGSVDHIDHVVIHPLKVKLSIAAKKEKKREQNEGADYFD